ncbi:MAG: ABC transporter permease [Alicyclobacillus macrosporangiidus]|uniref:ABC transporter permease n=1 Tax=Alicyclobacillus macrosporangiidus TaxID=392015 RepID=UPI0026EA4E29|nr:ABC transporter permease [Alicyclobacillus macrosporangiidus]MCL6599770.1 ABC transporter permease [Alicyclobacillus macrosporangiidus]
MEQFGHEVPLQTTAKASGIQGLWRGLTKAREISIFAIIVIMFIGLSAYAPNFLTRSNIETTIVGFSMDAIVAIGMTVALVSGGFDLSVGSMMAFTGVLAGMLINNYSINTWLAAMISLVLALLLGFVNGYFISVVGINPLIMTLGMMGVIRGIAYVITKGSPISLTGLSPGFTSLGQGHVLGLPTVIWIMIVLVVVGDILMRRSRALRYVYYIGSNEKAAWLSGIPVSHVKIAVYMMTALLSGLAGLLTLSRFAVADPTAGTGEELNAIAACVIGGASLSGGEGSILGALLGVLLVGLVNNGLVLLNVSVYWQSLVIGLVLIIAVTIDVYTHRLRRL